MPLKASVAARSHEKWVCSSRHGKTTCILCAMYRRLLGYSIQIAKNRLLQALVYSKIGFVIHIFPGTEVLGTAVALCVATLAIQ